MGWHRRFQAVARFESIYDLIPEMTGSYSGLESVLLFIPVQ